MKVKELIKKIWNKLTHNFIFIVVASFLWLLYKSGRKPSRITYPCQKAAVFNVGTFLYFFPLVYYKRFKHFVRHKFNFKTGIRYCFIVLIIFGLIVGTEILFNEYKIQKSWIEYNQKSKEPVGNLFTSDFSFTGRVIGLENAMFYQTIPSALGLDSPHRVVSVHNSLASDWNGSGNPHDHFNQEEVSRMVERGILSLTGESDIVSAWQSLIPYQEGEAVAIKLNFNNAGSWTEIEYMNPYAELVNAIIKDLVDMGVPGDKIWLVDPSRVINDDFRNRIINQNVLFYTASNPGGRERVIQTSYVGITSPEASIVDFSEDFNTSIRPAQVFVDADHLINVPQLKGHGGASITLGLKNHYGSAIIGGQSRSYWHKYFYQSGSAYRTGLNPIIEINKNYHIMNKTRLTIGDGLHGHPSTNNPSQSSFISRSLWRSFDNSNPEILFFGVDPVAVDSVMFDYLQREDSAINYPARNDDILEDAATAGLGVFEHWDGDDTRQYSAIDYIEIELDSETCSNCLELSCDRYSDCSSGSGICSNGYCCQGTCPPARDSIADKTIEEGSNVNMVVEGINCNGKNSLLEYYEIDNLNRDLINGSLYGLPETLVFSSGEARFIWTAQRFDDIDGDLDNDPEIMFIARCESCSYESDILEITSKSLEIRTQSPSIFSTLWNWIKGLLTGNAIKI